MKELEALVKKTEKVLRLPLFKRWLEDKAPLARVGNAGCPTECPIAEYLLDALDLRGADKASVEVSGASVYFYSPGLEMIGTNTPYWAEQFIVSVDCSTQPIQVSDCITARKALSLLKRVEQDMNVSG